MRRIKDGFVPKLDAIVPLDGKAVLEIGCGNGRVTQVLAQYRAVVTGIDTDRSKIREARNRDIPHAMFVEGSIIDPKFPSHNFDMAIFTLSLHEVFSAKMMEVAIDEAIAATNTQGSIVFLEPGTEGSYFEAELRFNAMDGDEREVKKLAYRVMQSHPRLVLLAELEDEAVFMVESRQDFLDLMKPRHGDFVHLDELTAFLERCSYKLTAKRRINIYKIKP